MAFIRPKTAIVAITLKTRNAVSKDLKKVFTEEPFPELEATFIEANIIEPTITPTTAKKITIIIISPISFLFQLI